MGSTAGEVMTKAVATVGEETSVEEMVRLLQEKGVSGVPVLNGEGKPCGLISQNDVLRAMAYSHTSDEFQAKFPREEGKTPDLLLGALDHGRGLALATLFARPVKDLMTTSLVSCREETPLAEACRTMTAGGVHRLLVLDGEGKVAGILAASDLVRHLAEHLE